MYSFKIHSLTNDEVEFLDSKLDEYDRYYIKYQFDGEINIGISNDGVLIAGISATITAFKILYVSTVFVDEKYRRQGLGSQLIFKMEEEAKKLGVNTIRLDTFSWQGKGFYEKLGYTEVGFYSNEEDNYEEYFFLKRI